MKEFFRSGLRTFIVPKTRGGKSPDFSMVGANFRLAIADQRGISKIGMGILGGLISVVVVIIVLARTIPILWPLATEASGNITAMTGTDAGTEMIQAFWPVVLLIVGISVAIGVIMYALNRFGVLGSS